jgi:hypothetical protein
MDMDPDIQRNSALMFCYPQSFFFKKILNLRKIISASVGGHKNNFDGNLLAAHYRIH